MSLDNPTTEISRRADTAAPNPPLEGERQPAGGETLDVAAGIFSAAEDIFALRLAGQRFTDDPRAAADLGSIGLQRYLTPNLPRSRDDR